MSRNQPIIGLTGAPGAGKSTVARQFHRLGCAVIDADKLNHEILTHREVIHKIAELWGPQVLDPAGQVDRKALGRIVFADERELKKLTDLLHPSITRQEKALLAQLAQDPRVPAVVLDVPLLFEVGQDAWCDVVIFVDADPECRRQRLKTKRHWSEQTATNVENLQQPLDGKRQKADFVITNDSGHADLNFQVQRLFQQILPHRRHHRDSSS